MEQLAVERQQYFYEHLPNWFLYNENDYIYIKQHIGYAILGPKIDQNGEDDDEMFTKVKYDKKSCKIISAIYKLVLDYGRQVNNNTSSIYLGIIYNIVFNHTVNVNSKCSTDARPNEIYALPIFKIKRDVNTIWYIDIGARVYKTWEDYLNNNTLPKCIMLLPKDGEYQCNPHSKVTEYASTVWVVLLKSPACMTSKTVLKVADITVDAVSIVSAVGLGAAAILNPVGPVVVAAGLATCGATALWKIARGTTKLIDRGIHKESVNPTNLSALATWIEISTSVLTVGANSGTMMLSRAISNGIKISEGTKIAYNSVIISNLAVHGISTAYQGHYLIDQYMTNKKVSLIDTLIFSSQILFLSNVIINTKLAGELIGTSNGTCFEKFKNLLRLERFQAEYNGANNVKSSNSTGIIRKFKRFINKTDFMNFFERVNLNEHMKLDFQDGKIQVNGITLVDPILLTQHLITGSTVAFAIEQFSLPNVKTVSVLKNLLLRLLTNFYSDQHIVLDEESIDISRFDDMLTELKSMEVTNAKHLLKIIFKMGVHLALLQRDPVQYVTKTVQFIWEYVKINLKQTCLDKCCIFKAESKTVYTILRKIITKVFELIDELTYDLHLAFHTYVSKMMPSYCTPEM